MEKPFVQNLKHLRLEFSLVVEIFSLMLIDTEATKQLLFQFKTHVEGGPSACPFIPLTTVCQDDTQPQDIRKTHQRYKPRRYYLIAESLRANKRHVRVPMKLLWLAITYTY